MAALQNMERSFGADVAIYLLKANVSLAAGRPKEAINYARKGIELEPGHEDVYWSLVTALMAIEDYQEGIRVLETLESGFGYAFVAENFHGNEVFAGFIESPEFVAWSKRR